MILRPTECQHRKNDLLFFGLKKISNSIGVLEMLQCFMKMTLHCYLHRPGPLGEVIAGAALNMGENCQNEKLPF